VWAEEQVEVSAWVQVEGRVVGLAWDGVLAEGGVENKKGGADSLGQIVN